MRERIAYCKECKSEYNLFNSYGEKCKCGADLFIAEKINENWGNCIKVWDLNNITKGVRNGKI